MCIVYWKRLNAASICGARRFSPSVNECARNVPKFGGAQALKILRWKAHIRRQELKSATSKDFASSIQFNVLQHDVALGIESETLSIQFNVVQYDRSAF